MLAILAGTCCQLYGHGELEIRITKLGQQIATNAANAQLFLDRAELHRLHQDWPAATADLDRAAMLDTNLVTVMLVRARVQADCGRLQEASDSYDRYLLQAPTDGVGLIERARVRVKLNSLEAALADYAKAISVLPEPLPEYFIERADLTVRYGQRDRAILVLDEGLQRLGVIVTLQSRALELELERNNFGEALRRLETITARANRQELWLEKKGQILRQAGREPEAVAAFHSSLRAVAKLPARLQTTPQMEALKKRVSLALTELAAASRPAITNR